MTEKLLTKIIQKLIKQRPATSEAAAVVIRQTANAENLPSPANWQLQEVYQKLLQQGKLAKQPKLEQLLRKRAVRTLSGVATVAVLTKPYACPGTCVYCPTEKAVPKSYLSNEPAVMRAIANKYDPYWQVQSRLKMLQLNGHATDKIELIVMGGTWSYFSRQYKYWFIKECFRAANEFKNNQRSIAGHRQSAVVGRQIKNLKLELLKEQKKNEKATNRIIGLTLETRPDYINQTEIKMLRELGCTRVELGVQNIDEKILQFNRRGHGLAAIVEATRLLKLAGFKICYHLMPNLPGATLQTDQQMFETLFSDERFQPDMIKIYPCVVTRGSLLYYWFKQKKYRTYTDQQLISLLVKIKKALPEYVRVNRLYRDIPAASIVSGCKISNLRQVLENKVKCQCIRCREIGLQQSKIASRKSKVKLELKIIKYPASGGQEYFLQFVDRQNYLYAFLRLRLNSKSTKNFLPEINQAALIRELHTYGQLTPLAQGGLVQHTGLGKKLLAAAEKIARQNGYTKLAVISGVGVREYYKKAGYHLVGSYMVKNLAN